MRLFPNARDEHLNGKENLRRAYMFLFVRPVTMCLTWCSEKVVQFPGADLRLVIFQRVFLTRSVHRQASLMGIGAMRRSYGDCRHQCAQESSGVGLIWFAVHNIGCGSRKCPSMRWPAASVSRQRRHDFHCRRCATFLSFSFSLPKCYISECSNFDSPTLFCSTNVIGTIN